MFHQIFDSNFLMFIAKLCLAMILGLLLGLERIYAHKTAGMRTYALISVATALFSSLSILIIGNFQQYAASFSPVAIPGAIITGIGFLGAGLIIFNQHEHHVENLTTAAGMWVCAGIGIACGFAMFKEAIFGTILTFFVLGGLSFVERRVRLAWYPDPKFEKEFAKEQKARTRKPRAKSEVSE